jgi:ribulose-5-phosphate 4-epimerase/fuculose-1-phosphate aldolase
MPEFNNDEDERRHRKERLVAACRAFALKDFDYGFAGHLTVRDPERPELYWTNPMCVHVAKVKMSNLILVDHQGRVIEGNYAVNRAGFVLHANVHEEHPDIIAMCHARTVYGTAWASMGQPIEPIAVLSLFSHSTQSHFMRPRTARDRCSSQRRRSQGLGNLIALWMVLTSAIRAWPNPLPGSRSTGT